MTEFEGYGSQVVPFQDALQAIRDSEMPVEHDQLQRFSDLEGDELEQFERVWAELPTDRRQALMAEFEALGVIDTVVSFEALGKCVLSDEDPVVRLHAAQLLWEYENRDICSRFLDLLVEDVDEHVRAAAAKGLGKYVLAGELDKLSKAEQLEIEESLKKLIESDKPDLERQRALESLGYSSSVYVNDIIAREFGSEQIDWVACALRAMGHSANSRWIPSVVSKLDSRSPRIRAAAVRAAGDLEIRESVPSLLELLDDPDEKMRKHALAMLKLATRQNFPGDREAWRKWWYTQR